MTAGNPDLVPAVNLIDQEKTKWWKMLLNSIYVYSCFGKQAPSFL